MEITVSQEQGRVPVTVLQVKGKVDSESSPQLLTRAQEAIAAGAHDLLIDLSGVPYMSSAGLKVINNLFNQLHPDLSDANYQAMQKGIRDGTFKAPHLKLLSPTPRVLEVLRLAGYDSFLGIHHELKDALASF